MSGTRALPLDNRGAGAAEFAMVLPVMLIFLFGIIDAGRYLWEYNQAEKATQMGVRYAVATNPVPSGLLTYSFATSGGIPAGVTVPTSSFDYAVCDDTDCSDCAGSACASITGYDPAAFTNVVDRMADMYPAIEADNVEVEYRNVGLGFAGDPNGPDVAPLVTVRLTDLTFQPLTTLLFGVTINMPDFRAALTLEDGACPVPPAPCFAN